MKRVLPLAFALTLGLAVALTAKEETPSYTEGTPVVVLGMVSSQPRDAGFVNEKKMQVAVGPQKTDYTLHLADAKLFGFHGTEIGISDLQDKMWVRAEGTVMDDSRRVKVNRMQVIGMNVPTLEQTSYRRSGYNHGYVMATGSPATPAMFREGRRVAVVGRVSSPPKGALDEKKMQVAVGPAKTDYTLHFADAQLIGLAGQKIDEDGFDDGQWVRAEGTVMDDSRRIKVDRVQIIGEKGAPNFASSIFHRPGLDYGYVTPITSAVAGTRETFPTTTEARFAAPFTLVGRVSDDTGAFESTRRIQVMSGGNEWTLHVNEDALVRDAKGEKISVHEIDKDQWVRATGWQIDDLRMRVLNIENIGSEEAFRASRYFRTASPTGYFERSIGDMRAYDAVTLRGTVVRVNRDRGFVVVRDQNNQRHRVFLDQAFFDLDGRSVGMMDIREGDMVTVTGRTIRY